MNLDIAAHTLDRTTGPVHHLTWLDIGDLVSGWGAAQTATMAGAAIAVLGVAATILTTSARASREHRASLFAAALAAVADYNEGPYRIRRKDGTDAHRNAITAALSDVKSAIVHNQALLQLHARRGVADAYDRLVDAAKSEAGRHMFGAWELPAITEDKNVNLGTAYERSLTDSYQREALRVMQIDLARRWYRPWHAARYAWFLRRHLGRPALLTPPARPDTDDDTGVEGVEDVAASVLSNAPSGTPRASAMTREQQRGLAPR